MPGALLHRFTREDYYRMAEGGVLQPDARVELLDGQIVDMFANGPFHGSTVFWLTNTLIKASHDRWLTFTQSALNLGEFYEPQPDFMLLRPREGEYRTTLPTAADVYLIIEVSDSSLLLDRTEKLPAYASANIPEVWIVNVPNKVVEIYSEPSSGAYAQCKTVKPGGRISPQSFPDVSLSVSEILGM